MLIEAAALLTEPVICALVPADLWPHLPKITPGSPLNSLLLSALRVKVTGLYCPIPPEISSDELTELTPVIASTSS